MSTALMSCFARRVATAYRRTAPATTATSRRALACAVAEAGGTEAATAPRPLPLDSLRRVQLACEARQPNHGLPSVFYTDPHFFRCDLDTIWYKEWIFAAHDCELSRPGDWVTLQIGAYPLVLVRGKDNIIRAFHNVCRHRGYKVCEAESGHTARRLVCPYHLWSYNLDGSLAKVIDPNEGFDPANYGLKSVAVESAGGYIFICLSQEPKPFKPLGDLVESYLAPFDLRKAKVAHQSRIVEQGNWKMVWENNRECYHCRASHPELSKTFPDGPWIDGLSGTDVQKALVESVRSKSQALGMRSAFEMSEDFQYRLMRVPLANGGRSFTDDGKPAVKTKRLGRMPLDDDVGDVLMYHYPNTWNHFLSDHAISFRMLPISPGVTELVTKWLVPGDAIVGEDYDLDNLTKVWLATNLQDQRLVERNTVGVSSPAYQPGPYNTMHERALDEFVTWYAGSVLKQLRSSQILDAA